MEGGDEAKGGAMMGWFWPGMHGYGAMGMVMGWLAIAVLITVVVLLATLGARSKPVAGSSVAKDLLDQRYARGEIDDEEYRRRRELLGL
jgi:putative membrane protein